MANALGDAISPYLRAHADNPVDWMPWGEEAFAEAARRHVPVLVSIGYATCHWCHVMARESFADAALADYLNEHFVAVKVDREEHPEVDSSYLLAASAFTRNLGWPLNVFVTPEGRAFFAGTYWPPRPAQGVPSFRQVLESVVDAWLNRREQLESNASDVADAVAAQAALEGAELPDAAALETAVTAIAAQEDTQFGGFGSAPKFPVVPVLDFLLTRGTEDALGPADRALTAMAGSGLRDPVEGGFFRYATHRDWTEPHYERMLYDNAGLLAAYALLAERVPESAPLARAAADGIAGFLFGTMRLPDGFASAQNSESLVDGVRSEGGYYALDREARSQQPAPELDEKILTAWNGLAIEALAVAGLVLERPEWVSAAAEVAEGILAAHRLPDGRLIRASRGGGRSSAPAALDDYGLLARGLLALALATGETSWAVDARRLVDLCLGADGFTAPGGGDPVLAAQGLSLPADPSEGAHPSGLTALAGAARTLFLLGGERRYRDAAESTMERLALLATASPMGFGSALALMSELAAPITQLVVVGEPDAPLARLARRWWSPGALVAVVTDVQAERFAAAGFELFEGRTSIDGEPAAYLCHDFVCRLPVTREGELGRLLGV